MIILKIHITKNANKKTFTFLTFTNDGSIYTRKKTKMHATYHELDRAKIPEKEDNAIISDIIRNGTFVF